eukprot:gene26387-32961_t
MAQVDCPLAKLNCCGPKCTGKFMRALRKHHFEDHNKDSVVIEKLLLKIESLSNGAAAATGDQQSPVTTTSSAAFSGSSTDNNSSAHQVVDLITASLTPSQSLSSSSSRKQALSCAAEEGLSRTGQGKKQRVGGGDVDSAEVGEAKYNTNSSSSNSSGQQHRVLPTMTYADLIASTSSSSSSSSSNSTVILSALAAVTSNETAAAPAPATTSSSSSTTITSTSHHPTPFPAATQPVQAVPIVPLYDEFAGPVPRALPSALILTVNPNKKISYPTGQYEGQVSTDRDGVNTRQGHGLMSYKSGALFGCRYEGWFEEGRRVNWGNKGAKGKIPPSAEHAEVKFSYWSKKTNSLVFERTLHQMFSSFGCKVIDVTINKHHLNKAKSIQSGDGFVHFPLSPDGIRSAQIAVRTLHNALVEDHVHIDCELSYKLEKYIEEHGGEGAFQRGALFNSQSVDPQPVDGDSDSRERSTDGSEISPRLSPSLHSKSASEDCNCIESLVVSTGSGSNHSTPEPVESQSGSSQQSSPRSARGSRLNSPRTATGKNLVPATPVTLPRPLDYLFEIERALTSAATSRSTTPSPPPPLSPRYEERKRFPGDDEAEPHHMQLPPAQSDTHSQPRHQHRAYQPVGGSTGGGQSPRNFQHGLAPYPVIAPPTMYCNNGVMSADSSYGYQMYAPPVQASQQIAPQYGQHEKQEPQQYPRYHQVSDAAFYPPANGSYDNTVAWPSMNNYQAASTDMTNGLQHMGEDQQSVYSNMSTPRSIHHGYNGGEDGFDPQRQHHVGAYYATDQYTNPMNFSNDSFFESHSHGGQHHPHQQQMYHQSSPRQYPQQVQTQYSHAASPMKPAVLNGVSYHQNRYYHQSSRQASPQMAAVRHHHGMEHTHRDLAQQTFMHQVVPSTQSAEERDAAHQVAETLQRSMSELTLDSSTLAVQHAETDDGGDAQNMFCSPTHGGVPGASFYGYIDNPSNHRDTAVTRQDVTNLAVLTGPPEIAAPSSTALQPQDHPFASSPLAATSTDGTSLAGVNTPSASSAMEDV